MKNLKNSLLIVGISLLFISCVTDENSPADINAKEQDLIGTWNLIAESQDGTVNTKVQGIPVTGSISSVGKDIDAQIAFAANPNTYIGSGGYTDVIKISAIGQTLVETEIVVPLDEIINQGNWSLNQGILSLTQNSVQQNLRITELTSTSLKIELDIEDEEVTYQDFTGTINTTVKMTFNKQ